MAATMICLDSYALLWWALDPDRLSPTARDYCQRMEVEGGIASSISLWEIGLKIKHGQLDLGMSIEQFEANLQATHCVKIIPVSTELWLANLALDWEHRDPADRTIVVTAIEQNVPLLTKDTVIRSRFPDITVW